jgi:NDP-sugar pyrophosphorylase family protein
VESDAEGFVTAFREKAERASGFVNTGIYLLPRALIAAIPAGRAVSIETEIFPALAAQRKLVARPAPPPLLDMGTPAGLAALERFLTG